MGLSHLRLLMSIPLLAGSLVTYPQIDFPSNLYFSTQIWSKTLNLEITDNSGIQAKWESLGGQYLSKNSYDLLWKILNLVDFQSQNLPAKDRDFLEEYGYLAIYLSGLNPIASGEDDRQGAWMLTFPAAARNGLTVNEVIDERFDFAKSTRAARLHFEELKKIHPRNPEAAFVLSPIGLQKSAEKQLEQLGSDLRKIQFLMNTTIAQHNISKREDLNSFSFYGVVSVQILKKEFAISNYQFKIMNPSLVGNLIPKGTKVSLPIKRLKKDIVNETKAYQVAQNIRRHTVIDRLRKNTPNLKNHNIVSYKVRAGDYLSRIALHYGVSVLDIKEWNNLTSDLINANQKLTIYLSKKKKIPPPIIAQAKPKSKMKSEKKGIEKFTIYEVQAGDTLWAISKQFDGVRPEQIMEWNGISENLSIGQKLKIKTH